MLPKIPYIIYFIALIALFLSGTYLSLRSRTQSHSTQLYKNLRLGVAGLVIASILAGWFGNSIGLHQHFVHAIYRAVEEGVYVIRSTNNGISAFISPYGKIIKSLKSDEKGVIEVKIPKYENNTVFSKYGNKIFFLIIILYIFLILVLNNSKKFK